MNHLPHHLFRIGLVLLGLLWITTARAVVPKPSVALIIKQTATTDETNLADALPLVKEYLEQRGLTVPDGGETEWRIEISGVAQKCPFDANLPGYTLYLTAFDNSRTAYIAKTMFKTCANVPMAELVMKIVTTYTTATDPGTQGDQKRFFDSIDRYFYARQNSVVVMADTSRPVINVYAPQLLVSRGMRPVANVRQGTAVEVVGNVSDPGGRVVQLTLNGRLVELDAGGMFRTTLTVTTENYLVVLEARDAANNRRPMEFMLTPQSVQPVAGTTDPAPAEKRLALVIGNSTYITPIPTLHNTANDADAMANALRSLNFDVILVKNAGKESLKLAMDRFRTQLTDGHYTVALFYYSGHGAQHDGQNYLVPTDARNTGDAGTDCVEVQRVINQMEATGALTRIVILDACRNDPFKKGLATVSDGPVFMKAPKGTLIAFATAPGSTASDGDGANGTYTEALLTHMPTPNLPIMGVFQQVRKDVATKTNNAQIPWESTSLTGDFYFRR